MKIHNHSWVLVPLLAVCWAPFAGAQMKAKDTRGQEWWKHAVFYEVYPRSFADSNGDGIGDLNGITSKLDYLKDLGVDAIWITPCFPSPQVDFGYDVTDYEAIDPIYGTLADFDKLAASARQHHIRIILDFVVNHTSDQHPWFPIPNPRGPPHIATGTSGATAKARSGRPITGPPPSARQPGPTTRPRNSITIITSTRSSRTSTGAIPPSKKP